MSVSISGRNAPCMISPAYNDWVIRPSRASASGVRTRARAGASSSRMLGCYRRPRPGRDRCATRRRSSRGTARRADRWAHAGRVAPEMATGDRPDASTLSTRDGEYISVDRAGPWRRARNKSSLLAKLEYTAPLVTPASSAMLASDVATKPSRRNSRLAARSRSRRVAIFDSSRVSRRRVIAVSESRLD